MSDPPIINESTSFVQIDTTGLTGGSYALVYVSSTTIPGQVVTVRDQTGSLSTPQAIVVSTVGGSFFSDGAYSTVLQQRYASLTLHSEPAGLDWAYINTSPFADPNAPAVAKTLATRALEATATARVTALASTASATAVGVEIGGPGAVADWDAPAHFSTLYVNLFSAYQASSASD